MGSQSEWLSFYVSLNVYKQIKKVYAFSGGSKKTTMKKTLKIVIMSVISIGVVIFSALCWHSIEEIYYLKSFFPKSFTVEETMYASVIELIKILIIGFPFFLIIGLGLLWLHHFPKR